MFSAILKAILDNRDITPYQISKDLGIGSGVMHRYVTGENMPEAKNLVKIADYLNVSTDFLLGRSEGLPNSASNISNSVVAQGRNSKATIGSGTPVMSTKESELFRIFKILDVKGQNKIVALALELEGEYIDKEASKEDANQ